MVGAFPIALRVVICYNIYLLRYCNDLCVNLLITHEKRNLYGCQEFVHGH